MDSEMDSPPPTPQKQPFFLAVMLALEVHQQHPGHVLAILTLINIAKFAAKDLHIACLTYVTGSPIVGALIARLSTLATKVLQHFWGLTGSSRGWINGLEDPACDTLFTATYGVQAIASHLLSEWETRGNVLKLVVLLREIISIQVLLHKLTRLTPTSGTHTVPATSRSTPPSPIIAAAQQIQYDEIDKLQIYFRATKLWDDFIAKPPLESAARIAQHDVVVDLLIERVLIPVDSVRSYGEQRIMGYKIGLVREVGGVFERMGEAMTMAAKEEQEGWPDM